MKIAKPISPKMFFNQISIHLRGDQLHLMNHEDIAWLALLVLHLITGQDLLYLAWHIDFYICGPQTEETNWPSQKSRFRWKMTRKKLLLYHKGMLLWNMMNESETCCVEKKRTYGDEQTQAIDILFHENIQRRSNVIVCPEIVSCLTTQVPKELLFYQRTVFNTLWYNALIEFLKTRSAPIHEYIPDARQRLDPAL